MQAVDQSLGHPRRHVQAVVEVAGGQREGVGRQRDPPARLAADRVERRTQLAHERRQRPAAVAQPADVPLVERAGVFPVLLLEAAHQRLLVAHERRPAQEVEVDAVGAPGGQLGQELDLVAAHLAERVAQAAGGDSGPAHAPPLRMLHAERVGRRVVRKGHRPCAHALVDVELQSHPLRVLHGGGQRVDAVPVEGLEGLVALHAHGRAVVAGDHPALRDREGGRGADHAPVEALHVGVAVRLHQLPDVPAAAELARRDEAHAVVVGDEPAVLAVPAVRLNVRHLAVRERLAADVGQRGGGAAVRPGRRDDQVLPGQVGAGNLEVLDADAVRRRGPVPLERAKAGVATQLDPVAGRGVGVVQAEAVAPDADRHPVPPGEVERQREVRRVPGVPSVEQPAFDVAAGIVTEAPVAGARMRGDGAGRGRLAEVAEYYCLTHNGLRWASPRGLSSDRPVRPARPAPAGSARRRPAPGQASACAG